MTQDIRAGKHLVFSGLITIVRISLTALAARLRIVRERNHIPDRLRIHRPGLRIQRFDDDVIALNRMLDIPDIEYTVHVGDAGIAHGADNRHQTPVFLLQITFARFQDRPIVLQSLALDELIEHLLGQRTPREKSVPLLEGCESLP